MQRQKSFGRHAVPRFEPPSPAPKPVRESETPAISVDALAPLPADYATDGDVDRDIEQWDAMRKAHKRSFREPWRSVCIAATLMFGLSSWLLPDSVADVAELVTTGLAAAAFFAGFRKR